MSEPRLDVLRAVRFKLIARPEVVGLLTGLGEAGAVAELEHLGEAGFATESPRGWRLTPDGQAMLLSMLETELAAVDTAAAHATHERFLVLDAQVKTIVTDHQMSGAESVSDENLRKLAAVHREAGTVVHDAIALAPRLAPYAPRLDAALAELVGGDARYLAHPMLDSYHTTWFELHEELIHLAGLKRAEMEAGSAQ